MIDPKDGVGRLNFPEGFGSNSVQKAVDLTTSAKNGRKMSICNKYEFSGKIIHNPGL